MINITNREMQIKTTVRYPVTPLDRVATIKNPRKTSVCKNMEKSEHLCIVSCDIKWYSCWKQYGIFLKKLNTEFLRYPTVSLLDIFPEELKVGSQGDTSTHMFIAVLFIIAEMWKQQPKYPLKDEWISRMGYIHSELLFRLKKEGSCDMLQHVRRHWRHYIKWNMPVIKTQILYDSP